MSGDEPCALDDVLITDSLDRRPSRPPDHAAEARALGALAETLATNPRGLLQQVAEMARVLCRADSAGVSILEPGGALGVFRWSAIAGAFAGHVNGTIAREASPCSPVIERGRTLLFDRPHRHFPALRALEPLSHELLLAPWQREGAPAGTLWVIGHTPDRHFDAEDARLLTSLATFAAAAWQTVQALEAAEAGRAALEERVQERTQDLAAANASLWTSDARKAFLLALGDAVRPLTDAAAIQDETARMLREHFGAGWSYYVEFDPSGTQVTVLRHVVRDGLPSIVGQHDLSDMAEMLAEFQAGRIVRVDDFQTSPLISQRAKDRYRAVGLNALLGAPVRKNGHLIAALILADTTAQPWSEMAIELTSECAERTWAAVERARAEASLRASEARYRALFESMDEGFLLAEVLVDSDGRAIDLLYLEANPAATRMGGTDYTGRRLRELDLTYESYWLEAWGRVARTGVGERMERYAAGPDAWFDFFMFRVGEAADRRVAVNFRDVTERKRREAHTAFVASITDELSSEASADDILRTVGARLGAYLDVDACAFHDVRDDPGDSDLDVAHRWNAPGRPTLLGRFPMANFFGGTLADAARAGETLVVRDTRSSPQAEPYAHVGIGAYVAVPFHRHGAWRFLLAVANAEPRDWRPDQIALIEEVTHRLFTRLERARAEAALRENAERYRLIVEGAREYAILTTDLEGRIESWSPGAAAVLGWTAAEAVGQPLGMTFVPEDRAVGAPEKEQADARAHGSAPDVRWHLRKDGARVFIEGSIHALCDDEGAFRGFLKIGQDVTRRRQTDEALRASEARYRTLVDNVRDYAIFRLDSTSVITDWTVGAERVTGYAAADAVGRHVSLLYPREAVAAGEVEREFAEAAATGRAERESWQVRKSGERFWANEIVTAIRDDEGALMGFTKISRDLTEQRLAAHAEEQAHLAAARDDLRRQLVAAEEAERRRLARELHDQLGQELTAFRLGVDDAARQAQEFVPPDAPLHGRLTLLASLAARMTAGARYLALELRPPELDDLGLESALTSFVAEWSARYGVAAEVAVARGAGRAIPADVSSALYRIAQEALTNVAKHAEATEVSVILENPDGEVRLIIEDDGRGFDVEATGARVRAERRLGLAGMRERAALVGGTVAVESRPGAGATLYVRLPLDETAGGFERNRDVGAAT